MYCTRHCATDGQLSRLSIEPSMGNTTRCELGLIFTVTVVAGHLPDTAVHTSTHPVGFKPAVSGTERPQTPALARLVE